MQEMVEPDRTILIVSIMGLVAIWGSVAYHKFVQNGAPVGGDTGTEDSASVENPAGNSPRKNKR